MQAESVRLEEPWCWISGDPSPPNWGMRGDSSPVLYDWALFRQGVPATDLAITARGMPGLDDFRATADRYLAICSRLGLTEPSEAEELARDMAVAKVGTVVVLLAAQARGEARVPANYIAGLVETVPDWIASLAVAL